MQSSILSSFLTKFMRVFLTKISSLSVFFSCLVLFSLYLHFTLSIGYAAELASQPEISDIDQSESYQKEFNQETLLWGDGTIETVSKRTQTALEAANTIYVISREEIESSGALEIADLFAFIPGLQVFYRSAQEPELIVRGLPQQTSPRLLVLVDGVTVYTLNTSGVVWANLPLTVDSLHSIEVIRGPSSVFYGANAFSGVINFVTRRPEHFKGAVARTFVGTQNLAGASSTLLLPAGQKGHFRFSGQYNRNSGFDIGDGPEAADSISSGIAMVDGFVEVNEKTQLRLGAWYRRMRRDTPAYNQLPPQKVQLDSIYTLAQLETELKNHHLKFYSFFYYEDSNNEEGPGFNTVNQLRFDFQIEDRIFYADKNYLSLGTNYRYNGSKAFFIGSLDEYKDLHLFSFYANNEWYILPNLIFNSGGRYEYDSFSKHNWSARANLTYLPHNNHSIRASITRAVRTPSFVEAEQDFVVPTPEITFVAVGNRNLDPEDILSIELGYLGYVWNNRLRLSFDFFFNDINNIIVRTQDFPDAMTLLGSFANVGDTQLYGIEYGIKLRAFDWWDVFFDHALTFQNNIVAGETPQHNINVGSRFMLDNGFSALVALKYISKHQIFQNLGGNVPTPENFRLDVRVAQKFWKKRLELAVTGQSLIPNTPEADLRQSARPDRRIFGTLSYYWNQSN